MPQTPRFPPNARRIEILAFSAVQVLDVTGPLQVFASANDLAGSATPPYSLAVIAAGIGNVTSSAGLGLVTAPLPTGAEGPDTLIVAGGQGVYAAADDPDLITWLRDRAARSRRIASVCTGAFLLGAAGLLDGRRAATHWTRCADLAARFPAARVEADPIFVRDGPVWSSAGVTAGIDLALAMVEEDHGRALALAVARDLVMFLKRPGGQAQFSAALATQGGDDTFGTLHRWIDRHLADDLSLPVLARAAAMSERSFSRRYAEATGVTPARAVERFRVEAARRFLVDTRQPLKRIAARCGLGSEETLRRAFLRLLAVSPQAYRERFSPRERALDFQARVGE